ncbi:MAG: thioredoxin family protein [Flavobacteriales bacterium]|nr:thioredoxin family protein [Flavobacteriales bacterium]|tara:strand:- start:2006 stop:2473 length:468 start_codon:yes stop_codon:yes gene_type:complete
MKKLFFISLLFVSLIAFGQEKAKWHTDFDEAVQVSVENNKPIMLFFTGSDWCPPCKKTKQMMLETKKFKDWAEKNLILVELDFPKRKENRDKQSEELKKQNENLQRAAGIRSYPSFVFIEYNKSTKELSLLGNPIIGMQINTDMFITQANKLIKK